MRKLYETKMISNGGRKIKVTSPDGSLELEISIPGGEGKGTNILSSFSQLAIARASIQP